MARTTLPRPTNTNIQGVIPPIEDNWFDQYAPSMQQAQPEEEPGFWSQARETAKAVGEGLKFLPGGLVDTAQDIMYGFDPADKEEMAQRSQTEHEQQAYHDTYAGKAFSGVTDAMVSTPYSLVTMGAGIAGGAVGSFAGPAGAVGGSLAASGTAAYRASKPQFQRTLYQATTDALEREPTPEEWNRVETRFEDEATRYGLWEAGPEAISNLLMVKVLGPLGSRVKGGIAGLIKGVAGLYGEELGTETITQMGQGGIEAELGLREEAPDFVDALKEVAPATFWQTTLMAGGKKSIDLAYNRYKNRNQNVSQDTSQDDPSVVPRVPDELSPMQGVAGALALPSGQDMPDALRALGHGQNIEAGMDSTGMESLPMPHGPIIRPGETLDLLALPESPRALPAGRGDLVMGMDSTGRGAIAPETTFSEPMTTPYSERLALPEQPLAGVHSGLWSGGKSQLAYGAPSFGLPGGAGGMALSVPQASQPQPVVNMPMPQTQGVVGGNAGPSVQPFGGVLQQAPRADTTAQAAQLGMPAPNPMPVPSLVGAGFPIAPMPPMTATQRLSMPAPVEPQQPVAVPVQTAPQGTPPVASIPEQALSDELDTMTRVKLTSLVSDKNRPLTKTMTKPQLVQLIRAERNPEPFAVESVQIKDGRKSSASDEVVIESVPYNVKQENDNGREETARFSGRNGEQGGNAGRGLVGRDGGSGRVPADLVGDGQRRTGSTGVHASEGGKTASLKIPNRPDTSVHYELVEAQDVKASHLPASGFQRNPAYGLENERRYHDEPGSQAKVLENAARLDPAFLLESVDANHGAPVVDHEGNVLGGNGRAMSIVRVYDSLPERSAQYRNTLKANAETLGLDPTRIDSMRQPVLVRRLSEELPFEERQQLVTAMNDDFKDAKEKRTSGKSRGDRFSPRTLSMLAEGLKDTDSLRQYFDSPESAVVVDKLMEDGVLLRTERNAYVGADGLLNPDGKKVLEEARMMLTPKQRADFDRQLAERSRSMRKASAESEVRTATQTTGGEIIATKHTQKGHDLYVARLEERVGREDYMTLLSAAKKLGGYYSRFRGNGAVPGFQFTERKNAEAFLKLAQGDKTDAQSAVQERRNAYEDDRSQTAIQRLNEMADKLDADADASLATVRKSNTPKRARQAASADRTAYSMKAMAQTMRNIATAITSNSTTCLDRVRQKTQVELLSRTLWSAHDNELRAKYPDWHERSKHEDEKASTETADYLQFPMYELFRSDWARLGRMLLDRDGTKILGKKILGCCGAVTRTSGTAGSQGLRCCS